MNEVRSPRTVSLAAATSGHEFEYEETRQKARTLLRAAEEAVRFAAGKPGTR